jgi:ABC-type antimicrobial peptide transport system permease subunit
MFNVTYVVSFQSNTIVVALGITGGVIFIAGVLAIFRVMKKRFVLFSFISCEDIQTN